MSGTGGKRFRYQLAGLVLFLTGVGFASGGIFWLLIPEHADDDAPPCPDGSEPVLTGYYRDEYEEWRPILTCPEAGP